MRVCPGPALNRAWRAPSCGDHGVTLAIPFRAGVAVGGHGHIDRFLLLRRPSGERTGYGGRDKGQRDKGHTAKGRKTAAKAGGGQGADAMPTTTSELRGAHNFLNGFFFGLSLLLNFRFRQVSPAFLHSPASLV